MLVRCALLVGCIALVAPGCSSSSDDDPLGDADAAAGTPDAGGGGGDPDAAGGGGDWTTLVTGTWSLAPGTEDYWCARVTVTEDLYIKRFRAIAPAGTHHTVVTISDPGAADGEFGCGPGTLSDRMLFASGVGTDEMAFPDGVAVKVEAGQQILLNLHLFNVDDVEIDGTSGTQVQLVPASEVEQQAEMVFGGTFFINLPPQQATSVSGSCTFNQDMTVVMLWPHMHQYGTHMEVTHNGASLLDDDYSFYEQVNYPMDPLLVHSGEKVDVRCDYFNSSSQTISFGDSSEDEMCFIGMYRYPAANAGIFCVL